MQRYASSLALLVLVAAATGCFSTSDHPAEDPMDVPLEKLPAQAVTTADGQQNNPLLLPHGTQIKWQKFFKQLPTIDERKEIARQLVAPLDNATPQLLAQQAHNQLALGQIRAAETSLREALRKSPENIEMMLDLAQIYLVRKDHTRAFEHLSYIKDAIESSETVAKESVFRYRYALAVGYIQRGERTRGHQILSDLIGLDKSFVPGYAALASSYLQVGKDKVAEFIAKRGLDRGKDDPALLNILGIVASNEGDLPNARSYFDRALNLSPTFAPALVNRANTFIKDGELEAAELNLTKAVNYAPADASALVALGVCQKRMGRYQEARVSFEKAIDIRPDDASARFNLGVLAMENFDQTNVALRLFHEVTQVAEADEKLKTLARVYIDDIKENRNND